jgi:hypothetical protein
MERREFLKLTLGFTAAAGAIAATAAQAAPLLPQTDGTAPPSTLRPEEKTAQPAGEQRQDTPADTDDHEISSRHRHHHHHHHHHRHWHWRRRWWRRHWHHHHHW